MAMKGNDVLLMVGGVNVGSQRNVDFSNTAGKVDISSKESDDAYWLQGRRERSIALDALYVPDDAGYILLQAAYEAGTSIEVWRLEDGNAIEEADAIVTDLSNRAPDQDAATISVTLDISGPWREVSS